jgi:hypothetical protein
MWRHRAKNAKISSPKDASLVRTTHGTYCRRIVVAQMHVQHIKLEVHAIRALDTAHDTQRRSKRDFERLRMLSALVDYSTCANETVGLLTVISRLGF